MTKQNTTAGAKSATTKYYQVSKKDLPLFCPTESMGLWNSHPRVYLPIEDSSGAAKCPYCGTEFKLIDE